MYGYVFKIRGVYESIDINNVVGIQYKSRRQA